MGARSPGKRRRRRGRCARIRLRKTGRGCLRTGRKPSLPQRWRGACGALSVRRRQPLLGQSRQRPAMGCALRTRSPPLPCRDVPPGYPPATGPAQRTLEQHRANSTVEVLACALPGAGCQTPDLSVSATNLGTLSAGSSVQPSTSRSITRAQARTYAHAVNLRGYDVPGMTQVAPEGPTEDGGDWETFARCNGELRSVHTVVTIHSPTFRYRDRLEDPVGVLHRRGIAKRTGRRPVPRRTHERARAHLHHVQLQPMAAPSHRQAKLTQSRSGHGHATPGPSAHQLSGSRLVPRNRAATEDTDQLYHPPGQARPVAPLLRILRICLRTRCDRLDGRKHLSPLPTSQRAVPDEDARRASRGERSLTSATLGWPVCTFVLCSFYDHSDRRG